MIRWLKVMYYFGYLPFHWSKDAHESELPDSKFRVSRAKTIVILIFDFLLALLAPTYFCLWHWINIEDFDMSRLLHASYYIQMNKGVVTTALTQFAAILFTSSMFWIFATFGKFVITYKVYLLYSSH